LIKLGDKEYELRVASAESSVSKTPYLKTYKHGEVTIHVKAGDFSEIMSKVVQSLENSYFYAANDNERNMIKDYIEHFRYGE